jgi:hypothetical protein
METKFDWNDFVNVCCDREGRFASKIQNLAVEPNADTKVVDSKRLALRQDAIENSGEKIDLGKGGLF